MNEELKIIITAATEGARQSIKSVKQELSGVSGSAQNASKGFGAAMKGITIAAAAVVTAIIAIVAAVIKLGKASLDLQKQSAQLNAAFAAMGKTATDAANVYRGFFRFLGDTDTATEASNLLIKLTQDEKNLTEWTRILQGVYASFPDSLPIEGLVESANETARVGKITGNLADALNWAGESEDEFNAKLAETTSYEEREALIRDTLNRLYGRAADLYEENNKALLEYNESQAALNSSMSRAGASVTPLLTALNNLSAAFFDALSPALSAIIPAIATFINWVTQGVQAIMSLISAITGASFSINSFASASSGISAAAGGAEQLASGLEKAAGAAEKVKRATMGFDELNVVPSNSSGGGGGGGSSGGAGGYMSPSGSGSQNFATEVEKTQEAGNGLLAFLKRLGQEFTSVFSPSIGAWRDAFASIKEAWEEAKPDFAAGAQSLLSGFTSIGTYLKDEYIPDIVNSFSVNFAPMFGDLFGFMLKEAGKAFNTLGGIIESASTDVIIPALDSIRKVSTDTFSYLGQAWARKGKELLGNASSTAEGFRDIIEGVYYDLLLPIWQAISDKANELWESDLGPLVETIINNLTDIGNELLILYNTCILPVVQWIQRNVYPVIVWVVEGLLDTIGDAVRSLAQTLSSITTMLSGLITFITGVFTKDWDKAWAGVKKIFGGWWDNISGLVRMPLNVIIDTINKFLSALGSGLNAAINKINSISITIPSWVPKYGGNTFGPNIGNVSMPQIPRLAQGGIVMSETLARIGEGGKKEAVLPLESNTGWMDMLADKLAARNSGASKIVLQLDGKELGWANINSINTITRQTGALQLQLV